jgi:hypothetical protein
LKSALHYNISFENKFKNIWIIDGAQVEQGEKEDKSAAFVRPTIFAPKKE